MKNYKKKYFVGVEGPTATLINDIEVTAKQFWKMIDDAEKQMKQSIEDNSEEELQQTSKTEWDYTFDTFTKHVIRYQNAGTSAIYFTIATAKDGYEWKH